MDTDSNPDLSGLRLFLFTRDLFIQRSVWRNPVGAGPLFCPIPRFAVKARQPWALGRNRFAVQKLGQTFLEYNFELY